MKNVVVDSRKNGRGDARPRSARRNGVDVRVSAGGARPVGWRVAFAIATLTVGLVGLSARADGARSAEAEKVVHGLARVDDPASAALVAATALADEAFGLSQPMRDLLLAGSELKPAPLNDSVVATLDADATVQALYRKACGEDWTSVREAYTTAAPTRRVEVVMRRCKPSLSDVMRPGYYHRICAGAVLLSVLAEADLAAHGATTGPERKLAHYVALLALAKAR